MNKKPTRPRENQLELENLFWQDLKTGYWRRNQVLNNYICLAELFSRLGNDDLSAYFHVVSSRKIPGKLLARLQEKNIDNVFGIKIPQKRKPKLIPSRLLGIIVIFYTFFGLIFLWKLWSIRSAYSLAVMLGFSILAVIVFLIYIKNEDFREIINNLALPLIMLALLVGSVVERPLLNTSRPPRPLASPTTRSAITPIIAPEVQAKLDRAVELFGQQGKTQDAIARIESNLLQDQELINYGVQEPDIVSAFKNIVGLSADVNYTEIVNYVEQHPTEKQSVKNKLMPMVTAIYRYQEAKGVNPDGVINLTDVGVATKSTMELLQQDIRNRIITEKTGDQ